MTKKMMERAIEVEDFDDDDDMYRPGYRCCECGGSDIEDMMFLGGYKGRKSENAGSYGTCIDCFRMVKVQPIKRWTAKDELKYQERLNDTERPKDNTIGEEDRWKRVLRRRAKERAKANN